MKLAGNKQRACIGGWLLAALLLIGLNAGQLMSLADQPLIGYSPTIKALRSGLQQFDSNWVGHVFSFASDIELPQPSKNGESLPAKAAPGNSSNQESDQPTILPSLTGIMQIVRPDGVVYFQAVLNGKVCRTNDKIDDFSVVKISPAGVVVRRAGFKWTIDSPKPYYSTDRGD